MWSYCKVVCESSIEGIIISVIVIYKDTTVTLNSLLKGIAPFTTSRSLLKRRKLWDKCNQCWDVELESAGFELNYLCFRLHRASSHRGVLVLERTPEDLGVSITAQLHCERCAAVSGKRHGGAFSGMFKVLRS